MPLEQQVKVTIGAAMQHPVFHLELVDDRAEHTSEDRKCLCLSVQSPLIHLLYVYVLVDRQLGAVCIEPDPLPDDEVHNEVGEQEK